MDKNIPLLYAAVVDRLERHKPTGAFTVAISGIDAAGKGYISRQLKDALTAGGYRVALINIDPWQNPIAVRLQNENAAEHVYNNLVRWDDLFEQLILPLKKNKSIYLETEGIRTDADIYYPVVYDLNNISILLVEGVFLLKKEYLSYYDLTVWIDCSFDTGLQRAISRNAENLDAGELVYHYHTFYYPAQRFHFAKDEPTKNAGLVIDNN